MRPYRNVNLTLPGAMISLPVSLTRTASAPADPKFDVVGPNGEDLVPVYVDANDKQIKREDTKRRSPDGKVFTQEQLKQINDACKIDDLQIIEIAPKSAVNLLRVEKNYHVYPNKKNGNARAFATFVKALERTNGVAVVKWTPSSRQELLAIFPADGELVAAAMSFADDFKDADDDVIGWQSEQVSDQEAELAEKLLNTVMGDGSSLAEAKDDAIALKRDLLAGGEVPETAEVTAEPAGADLVDQLQRALDAVEEKAAA